MKLCIATNNSYKASEIQALLDETIELVNLKEIGCYDELPENQDTLEGNSLEKAEYIWKNFGINCFADDSGLEIESLGGKPGVNTAFYSGTRDADENMNLVLKNLEPFSNRNAQFRTIISLILNGETHQFEGVVKGKIISEKKGTQGFGYDPIFIPEGFDKTFAEMNLSEKTPISHRGIATKKLVEFLSRIEK